MKRNAIRFVFLLHWVVFIALFIISAVFLLYCLINVDRRLIPAIISVLGTAAILTKEIYVYRKIHR